MHHALRLWPQAVRDADASLGRELFSRPARDARAPVQDHLRRRAAAAPCETGSGRRSARRERAPKDEAFFAQAAQLRDAQAVDLGKVDGLSRLLNLREPCARCTVSYVKRTVEWLVLNGGRRGASFGHPYFYRNTRLAA
eukprot:2963995-Pleurochrysis_carterae.AAC.2